MVSQEPIESVSRAGGVPGGQHNLSAQEQAGAALAQAQLQAMQLQDSLAHNASVKEIQGGVEKMHAPIEALNAAAPQMMPNEAYLIQNASDQHQQMAAHIAEINPAQVAQLQGTLQTIDQVQAHPYGAKMDIAHIDALNATNQLAALSDQLQVQLSSNNPSSSHVHDLINGMKEPAQKLDDLAKSDKMNASETEQIQVVVTMTTETISVPDASTPGAVTGVQESVETLNDVLMPS